MSLGPQYTSCVEASDWEDINSFYVGALIAAGPLAAIFTGGIGLLISIPAFVEAMRYVSDWMLNKKLICLHRDPARVCGDHDMVWAIGEVADTEDVGEDKNPIEDIDNDYAMNIILAPFDMKAFGEDAEKNFVIATEGVHPPPPHPELPSPFPQGDLLQRQPGMPKWNAYFRTMIVTMSDGKYRAWTEVVGRDYGWTGIIGPDQQEAWADYVFDNAWLLPQKRPVPVLHCEFEGSRIKDVLDAANTFEASWCKSNWFTKFLCKVIQILLSPIILVLIMAAWAGAKDGDPADALEGGGTINSKDQVIAGGRWTFDGGHEGWNEFHATRNVQKVAYIPKDEAGFADFYKRWCDEKSKVPNTDPAGNSPPGSTPKSAPPGPPLTAKQRETYDNQQRPENQWVLHPDIDGCEPFDDPGGGIH